MKSNESKIETNQHHLLQLVSVISYFYQKGWAPATSANYSIRSTVMSDEFFITQSGIDKSTINPTHLMQMHLDGTIMDPYSRKPSAETLLHTMIYRLFPEATCILHTHSVSNTVLSMLFEQKGFLALHGFELLKILNQTESHTETLKIPIFSNDQNMARLSTQISTYLKVHPEEKHGFLLAGHGLYTWGNSITTAKYHVEALEFIFDCLLTLKSHGYPIHS